MEKRLAIAIALCIGFVALWTWLFPPAKPPVPEPPSGTPATESAPVPESAPPPQVAPAAATPGPTRVDAPAPARADILAGSAQSASSEEEIAVDTPLLSVRLTNRGARATSWKLREYHDAKGEPLDLVAPAARKLDRMPLDLRLEDKDADVRLRQALYRVTREEREEGGQRTTVLTFSWSDGAGNSATKVLKIPDGSYVVELQAAAELAGRPIVPGITWGAGFEAVHVDVSEHMGEGTRAVVDRSGKIEHRYTTAVKPDAAWLEEGAIAWAGLESKYFAAILVPQEAGSVTTRVESLRHVEEGREQFHLVLTLLAPQATHVHLFAGPKDYDVLKGLGLGLDRLLDFGYFAFVALPLFYSLKFVERYVGNYGWAIVVLTVFIRLLFFPFMHKSQLKMRVMQEKMKRIQPKLKALKERYEKLERKEAGKGSVGARQKVRQQMNEDMMALYKEEGINPFSSMSGCLPLLAQMPILYAFYTILTIAIELRQAPFVLWVRDLSIKDPYYVTPILMGATMLVQQVMTSSAIPDVAQRRMMYIMPIMFTWFFINLPSGLVLYWLINNLLGILQQYLVNKEADARARAATA
jgi:YidC/Oxa1 family membrane protein insertase